MYNRVKDILREASLWNVCLGVTEHVFIAAASRHFPHVALFAYREEPCQQG